MDNRQGFPLLYEAHHALHPEDLAFWTALASQHPGPILELGCGAGRVSLALARAGCQTFGLDLDRQMLALCQRRLASEAGLPLFIFQGDMTAYHLQQAFSAICLPCNTFSTLSPAQRLATLRCTRRHLSPGGVFAASLPNPELLLRLPATAASDLEEFFTHPVDGEPVQVSSAWRRSGECFKVTWHYDHLLPDGRVERLSAVVTHRLERLESYEQDLSHAGFQLVQVYGDFDYSAYSSESPWLILTAQAV